MAEVVVIQEDGRRTVGWADVCPFCKNDQVLMRTHVVVCRNDECLAMGPVGDNDRHALVLWNRRGNGTYEHRGTSGGDQQSREKKEAK